MISGSNIKKFLEMIRRLQLVIRNYISLIRGKILIFRMTEVGRLQEGKGVHIASVLKRKIFLLEWAFLGMGILNCFFVVVSRE